MDKPLPNIPQYYLDFDKQAAKTQAYAVEKNTVPSAARANPIPWLQAALAVVLSFALLRT